MIEDSDLIGRCCFFPDQAKREKPRRGFIKRCFAGQEMSVDHLKGPDMHFLTKLHDREGGNRSTPLIFYGWYVFEVSIARLNGGEVVLDKTDENPWHANVIHPDSTEGQDAIDQFFKEISENSHWRDREESFPMMLPSIEEFLEQVAQDFE